MEGGREGVEDGGREGVEDGGREGVEDGGREGVEDGGREGVEEGSGGRKWRKWREEVEGVEEGGWREGGSGGWREGVEDGGREGVEDGGREGVEDGGREGRGERMGKGFHIQCKKGVVSLLLVQCSLVPRLFKAGYNQEFITFYTCAYTVDAPCIRTINPCLLEGKALHIIVALVVGSVSIGYGITSTTPQNVVPNGVRYREVPRYHSLLAESSCVIFSGCGYDTNSIKWVWLLHRQY